MKTKMSLHSDKCDNSYFGEEELGLTGEALENFKYALYEVVFGVDVNEESGEVEIETVNRVPLMTPETKAELERLREVEKDSTNLHNIVKQQAFQLRQLKGILEEMFKICPCMCNTALDYDCAKCEARRMLKAMEEQSQNMGSFCDTEKG